MPHLTKATTLRVATWNLYLGADLALLFGAPDLDELAARVRVVRQQLEATRFDERARAVATVLARERPHLVGLQEVARWTLAPLAPDGSLGDERVLVDFLPTLLAALQDTGRRYVAHAVNENFSGAMPVSASEWMGVTGANAVLVRDDVEVVDERTAPYETRHVVVTAVDGVSFPVVRSWGGVEARIDGARLRFVNTHTEAYDARVRDAQRDEVLAAHADTAAPSVLVGDLNATPDQVGVPAPWRDAWSRGEGAGPTCGQDAELANPVSTLSERIDYVWVRDATVLGCRVVGDAREDRTEPHGLWPSDHAAVVADLALPADPA
jgi:endonuclease/exonuclease/phosphatase family metal-dependent hydrolase